MPSQNSQLSQASQSRTRSTQLTDEEKENISYSTARYILNMMGSRHPIRRSEIVKEILSNSTKYFKDVIRKAKEILLDIYGLELYEVLNESADRQYIVLNTLPDCKPVLMDEMEKSQYGLLFLILAHIFMSGGSVTEDSVFTFLRQMNIISQDNFESHQFGNVKQLVTVTFPNMLYLSNDKNRRRRANENSQAENAPIQISWGERAHKELKKESVLSFVSEVYNRPVNSWVTLYNQIRAEQDE